MKLTIDSGKTAVIYFYFFFTLLVFFFIFFFLFFAVIFFSFYSTSPWWPRWSAPFGLNRAGSIRLILPQAGQLWPVHLGCICIIKRADIELNSSLTARRWPGASRPSPRRCGCRT